MQPNSLGDLFPQSPPTSPTKRSTGLLYTLAGVGGLFLLVCGCCFGYAVYMTLVGPATWAYKRGEIPQRFLDVTAEIGGLESGETVEYFYSDALVDIRDGFTYVSDRKVVVYIPSDTPPLTAIPFEAIQDVNLERQKSSLVDSAIFVETEDGFTGFSVSSEKSRDVEFYNTIRQRSPNVDEAPVSDFTVP